MKFDNAADDSELKDKAQRAQLRREQELEDIRIIAHTPSGLRFLKRLMNEGKVFTTTFTGNSQTFFFEGHRNLALKFLHDIVEASPESLTRLMLREPNED